MAGMLGCYVAAFQWMTSMTPLILGSPFLCRREGETALFASQNRLYSVIIGL